jgi:PEP-CTERM motif
VDATGGNDLLGSHAFTGSGIAQLEYSGTQGMIQVSTLRFNGTEVPEPATWALIVGGFAALAIRRLQQTG